MGQVKQIYQASPKCKLGERGGSAYVVSPGRSGLCTKSCDWGPELFAGRGGVEQDFRWDPRWLSPRLLQWQSNKLS